MKLNYFTITDTADELREKRNALAKKHHPDKFPDAKKRAQTVIMSAINDEYTWCMANGCKPKITVPAGDPQKQAQALFHALTNLHSIDVELLLKTIKQITDWDGVLKAYAGSYGTTLIFDATNHIADEELRNQVLDVIMSSAGMATRFKQTAKTVYDIFKNLSKN